MKSVAFLEMSMACFCMGTDDTGNIPTVALGLSSSARWPYEKIPEWVTGICCSFPPALNTTVCRCLSHASSGVLARGFSAKVGLTGLTSTDQRVMSPAYSSMHGTIEEVILVIRNSSPLYRKHFPTISAIPAVTRDNIVYMKQKWYGPYCVSVCVCVFPGWQRATSKNSAATMALWKPRGKCWWTMVSQTKDFWATWGTKTLTPTRSWSSCPWDNGVASKRWPGDWEMHQVSSFCPGWRVLHQ